MIDLKSAADFLTQSYDYLLPQERIAQYPSKEREGAKLMVLSKNAAIAHRHALFKDLPSFLPSNCVLIANDTTVVQARIKGKSATGGKATFLLLSPLPLLTSAICKDGADSKVTALGLLRVGAKLKTGLRIFFGPDLSLTVDEVLSFGQVMVTLCFRGDLTTIFAQKGEVPLPPYIKREATALDATRYQTVYANAAQNGSVAAPTAGLHFTHELIETLKKNGISWHTVTLHVGYGTFSPVRCSDIRDHKMHREYVVLSQQTAQALKRAKEEHRPIIAVGTTSVRAIEGAYLACGSIAPYEGWTDIFLYPGKTLNVIDGIITNFHLPQSTLLMLMATFLGRKRLLACYEEALANDYQFFSYGDSMLVLP